MREPSHRLTQHRRCGSRSLKTPWGCEEAPTLYFKGSKPEAVSAGWSLVYVPQNCPLAHHPCGAVCNGRADDQRNVFSPCHTWKKDAAFLRSGDRRACRTTARRGGAAAVDRARTGAGGNRGADRPRAAAPDPPRRVRGWSPLIHPPCALDRRDPFGWTASCAESPLRRSAVAAIAAFADRSRIDQANPIPIQAGTAGPLLSGAL